MSASRTVLIAILLGALAGNTWGDPRHGRGNEYRDRDDYDRRPIREVIGEVEHNYRGRVVDVKSPRPGSSEDMYRVRVLQDGGRVKTLRVPADRRRE